MENFTLLTFGDYYNDGHGQYKYVLAKVHSNIEEAERKLNEAYPNLYLASDYGDNTLNDVAWKALTELGYTGEQYADAADDRDYNNMTLEEIRAYVDEHGEVACISLVMDISIFLLNTFGAGIEKVDYKTRHYDNGYGCFW